MSRIKEKFKRKINEKSKIKLNFKLDKGRSDVVLQLIGFYNKTKSIAHQHIILENKRKSLQLYSKINNNWQRYSKRQLVEDYKKDKVRSEVDSKNFTFSFIFCLLIVND